MFQIIFKPTGSAEMSSLPKPLQLEILSEFNVLSSDFLEKNPEKFGTVKRGKRRLHRYRTTDYRIYFETTNEGLIIHRVLHKNSLKDFLFRSQLGSEGEDEDLGRSEKFWQLIDEPKSGENP